MKRYALIVALTVGLITSALVSVCSSAPEKSLDHPQNKSGTNKPMTGAVKGQAEQEMSQQRKKILDEATSAIQETKKALKALEDKKSDDALKALERATGKLNILLARDPHLALAPIDVAVTTHDLYATVDQIKAVRKQAENHLEKGEVQKARLLIRGLGSEIVISVTSLPLQTYPAAIAAVTPLIDKGNIEEAKEALQAALNTLVVSEHIMSLPLIRAEEKLAKAEELAQKDTRTDEESKTLAKLLEEAREQLKLSELLGYGTKEDYKKFYAEIEQIEDKTKGGKSAKAIFAPLKEYLADLKRSLFD
ncbi:MAG: YfdX family protein [Nitrospira sp.]